MSHSLPPLFAYFGVASRFFQGGGLVLHKLSRSLFPLQERAFI